MSPEWRPSAPAESIRARHDLLRTIRKFFDTRGFLEVETPLLSRDTVVDRHLDPIAVAGSELGIGWMRDRSFFLQTSPEFAMKRLLASGTGPIYQICKAFRGGEAGEWHNPEFTMLEWYDPRLDYAGGQSQLAELACELFSVSHVSRSSYRDMFLKYAGVDPSGASIDQLRIAIGQYDQPIVQSEDRDTLLDQILGESIQPRLGESHPEIICDWPASQAALAKRSIDQDGNEVAERFELYYRGAELANGYCELLDAEELLSRSLSGNALRAKDGKGSLPVEARLLDAMRSGLPPCCGCAMGLDRVLMLRTGANRIDEVLAFGFERA